MGIIGQLLFLFLQVYSWILLARALVSWIPNLDPYHPAVQFLHNVTEPVLEPIRKLIPPLGGMIDISIIIAFFAVNILSSLVRSAF
jgi:YggT family protein